MSKTQALAIPLLNSTLVTHPAYPTKKILIPNPNRNQQTNYYQSSKRSRPLIRRTSTILKNLRKDYMICMQSLRSIPLVTKFG